MIVSLHSKTAVITGGGGGIGSSIGKALAKAGANVMLVGPSTNCKDVAQHLCEQKYQADSFQCDVTQQEQIESLIEHTKHKFGEPEIWINNAGITRDALIPRLKEEDWDKVLKVNLKSVFLCIKQATKFMLKKRAGKIVNIASVVGIVGNAGQSNYAASKAGIIGMTRSAAAEFGSRNIQINAVAPGFINTNMTQSIPDSLKERYLARIPLKRFGEPEDVANLVVFLASNKANYITGQTFVIDGGISVGA